MKRRTKIILSVLATLAVPSGYVAADYLATAGAGTTVFAFTCFSTKVCPAHTLVNSAGSEIATAGAPVRVDPTGTTTQPVSASQTGTWNIGTVATITNPVAVTQSGTWTQGITQWAGGTLTGMQNYGTAPTGLVPGVNAFVTNTNPNGRVAATSSSPVVVAAGASTAGAVVPNNTTAVVVKASAGTLFGVQVYGIGSAPAYLKIYNATSATCGTGTPVKRLMIPAAATAANGTGSNVTFGPGLMMGTGITYCVTTGITDADTTAPAASTYLVNVDYE